jgi:hypothetical protein
MVIANLGALLMAILSFAVKNEMDASDMNNSSSLELPGKINERMGMGVVFI